LYAFQHPSPSLYPHWLLIPHHSSLCPLVFARPHPVLPRDEKTLQLHSTAFFTT
jgi:hypothetical protein